MLVQNSRDNIMCYISNFESFIGIVTIENINLNKKIEEHTKDELFQFKETVKELYIYSMADDYKDFNMEDVKILEYTRVESDKTGFVDIKIEDKEKILPATITIYIIEFEYNNNDSTITPDNIVRKIEVKRTQHGYFNFEMEKGENISFTSSNTDGIIMFAKKGVE